MRPEKPATQKEVIDQMWYALIGANSEGIAERVKQIDQRVRTIESVLPTLMTHREHADYVQGCADNDRIVHEDERRKKWRTTDVILGVMMLVVTAVSILGALL